VIRAGRRPHRTGARLGAAALGLLLTLLAAPVAEAYIGPGAGFAVLSSFLVLAVSFLLALLSLLLWPFRLLVKALRGRRGRRRASAERVVVLGLDGLDPTLVETFMGQGTLPNLARLRAQGTFAPLATSYPSISPAAWSSFMTGVDCSYHNIFDFLTRDPRTYRPVLSSAEISGPRTLKVGRYRIPLGKPRVKLLRKSRPFWKLLGEHGVFSSIIRVPITFPPEKFHGVCLSGMCAPDLRGSQGTFSYFTTRAGVAEAKEGGIAVPVRIEDGVVRTALSGPSDEFRDTGGYLTTPLVLRLDRARQRVTVEVSGQRVVLERRKYSPWVPVSFAAAPGMKVHGICRFYLRDLEPDLDLYVTPVQIDPEKPALPVSHPVVYSVYLSKLVDRFGTLGLAEDTWALNEGVIDEDAFLEQAYLYFDERERQFLAALDRTPRGLTVCVFDTPDRIQHMFFRTLDDAHPANEGKETARYKHVIEDVYRRMDALVGRIQDRLDDRSVLIVMSDHGFSPFRRGVNINTWLLQNGYLALKEGRSTSGEWFADVDWTRTRAYCLGLTGMFINRKGREGRGIVDEGEELAALKRELVSKLSGLVDAERGEIAIREIMDTAGMFSGPYLDSGPDLLLGYNSGYRTSWECASGKVTERVFENNTRRWSGDHCIDPKLVPGIFFCNRPINGHQPDIRDVAPTVLSLFGVPVPAYMDGQPLIQESEKAHA
jgi:predicted AlkP superfamily phosphohydrolase/phosphomutase